MSQTKLDYLTFIALTLGLQDHREFLKNKDKNRIPTCFVLFLP